MRFEVSRPADHLGPVRLYDLRRALELDSGSSAPGATKDEAGVQRFTQEAMADIERRMAIVLPIKNEDLKVFEGVLSGIPHDCLIIVISNSGGDEADIFKNERDILAHFCELTKRRALIVHQKDIALARAFAKADYTDILDADGLVASGKSEGMITGIMLALLTGKEYVGFIDTDNFIPGAVLEYARHYAAGFSLAKSPYSMVRILWRYKPKMMGELYFKRWGRVSEITNRFINALLSTKGKFETEVIKTANAGEHAMSLKLALQLTYGSGYAVETQELISVLEQFGGILPVAEKEIAQSGVEIIQTETINPHLHAEKGGDHLFQEMLLPSLSVIYHSPLCEDSLKELITKQLVSLECLKPGEPVPPVRLIRPPGNIDLPVFAGAMEDALPRYTVPAKEVFTIAVARKPGAAAIKKVLITDLDGCLLHPQTYSYSDALDAVRRLQAQDIPIVFCSAKTAMEQQFYREELGVTAPFIVENGGAIYVPKDYFRLPFKYDKALPDYLVIEFGIPRSELRHRLNPILDTACRKIETNPRVGGISINSFDNMSVEEIAKETGLSLKLAALAKQREYSETLKIEGDRRAIELALAEINSAGLLAIHGGRFYEVTGGNNKEKAARVLLEMYRLNYGDIISFGIGDGMADLPFLSYVDYPMLLQGADRRWQKLEIRNLVRVKGVGPEGWSRAIDILLNHP